MQPRDPVGDLCAIVGEDTVRAVARAFYERIPEEPLLAPLYPADDLDGARERLADFLVMRFGGSDAYEQKRGHPRLRMRHAPFAIGLAERDRWVACMDAALDACIADVDARERARGFLHEVATFLINA